MSTPYCGKCHKWLDGPTPAYCIGDLKCDRHTAALDEGYDAHRINWPRLWERVMASVINAIFYGGLLVAAKALGIL